MKKDFVIAAVAVVIVVALAFGLAAFRPNASTSTTTAKDTAAEKAIGSDAVVMRVNGDPVTEREFNLMLQNAPAEGRQFYATPAGKRAIADELVKLKVLEQEAGRMGLGEDPLVQTQIQMAKAQIAAARALEKLAEQKSEERIRSEYEKQKGSSISLRHILFAYQGGAVPARGGQQAPPEAAAMARAKEVATRLRGGADFAQAARAESDDEQSGARGGMLGPTNPAQLPPEVSAVITKMQPGQMSDPVKTQFGVHIFKVEQPSLEDLRPMLSQRVRQQVAEEEVKRLQDAAKVDLDQKFFPPAPAAPAAPGTATTPQAPPNG